MTTAEDISLTDRMNCPKVTDADCIAGSHRQIAPYLKWKGPIDRILAALMLIPSLPIIGLLVVLIRWTSPGPGIFRQVRVGRNGKLFTMYKLRSMRSDAEANTGAIWTRPGDMRVTRLGRVLRKLHLDELPQLINVLKGEMSLIGPRPERPEFVIVLEKHIAGYRDRLAVLPGITGLAQINLPPDTDLESVLKKQVLDLEYIRNATLPLDLRMLIATFLRMFGLSGTFVMRVMGLKREVSTCTFGLGRREGTLSLSPAELLQAVSEQNPNDLRYDTGIESAEPTRTIRQARLPR